MLILYDPLKSGYTTGDQKPKEAIIMLFRIVEVVEYDSDRGPSEKEVYVRGQYDSNEIDPKSAIAKFAPDYSIQTENHFQDVVIAKTRYLFNNWGNDYVVAAITEEAFRSLPKWRILEFAWMA